MNCREFLTEFEERQALSEPAQLHLNDCPDCEKTSDEQTRVWQMIDGLRQVDAPKDFDFRVKARIAQSKSADYQPRFFPVLRYVLPLSLVILVLGLYAFNTSFFFGDNTAPQIAGTAPQTPSVRNNAPSSSSTPEQFVAVANSPQSSIPQSSSSENTAEDSNIKLATDEPETHFVAVKSTKKLLTESRKANPKNNSGGGGSIDKTFSSPKILTPENLNPNKIIDTLPNAVNQNPITDVQVLSFIGIETVSEKGSKKVIAVKPDSLAARSDVKVGDVIEAIDGKRIGDKPVRMETFESRKLTVVRGAKKIEIVLQNKSN